MRTRDPGCISRPWPAAIAHVIELAAPGRRVATLLLALLGVGLAGVGNGQVITEIPISTVGGAPTTGIAAGPDGSMWFTEFLGIGRITADGTITDFPIIGGTVPTSPPFGIAADPYGNVWFTQYVTNQIGRLTTDGIITEFPVPTRGSYPYGITRGPDGFIWFTELGANQIGRITTDGVITEFAIGAPGVKRSPFDIVAGPDDNLWFTELDANRIGRMTTAGVVTEFPIPTPASGPESITAGPDGNLWFIESTGHNIGRITPEGEITEFPFPTSIFPGDIAAGPDGNLWFTESIPKIGRITTSGMITEFPTPTGDGSFAITAGPDGNLWFTEPNAARIGRVTPAPPCVADPATLCLNWGRFELRATWSVPSEGSSGVGTAVPLTGDTGYFWFFNGDNVELVIKALDGRNVNGHYWIFYGALSNVQYTITVTDRFTGTVKSYENPYGTLASFADTTTFSPTGTAVDLTGGVSPRGVQARLPAAPTQAIPFPKLSPSCTPGGTTLCLNQSRFQITVDWEVPSQGRSGHGTAIPITNDTGYFWFFNEANVELVIKVLDGRGINSHFWVFYGALSNVQYTITVTDTQTQTVKKYTNPSGNLASAADTSAF